MKPTDLERWRRLLAGLVLGLWMTASAWSAPGAEEPSNRAATLFHNYCSVCHGDKGDGKSRASGSLSTPPRDFTSAASKQELTRERIVASITHGKPGTAMVAWNRQLSADDIARLADHVFTRFVQPAPQAASKGRQIYERNCSVCHGDQGAGSMWARDNMARPPRDFTAPASQNLTREAMLAAVTHGKPGTPMVGFAGRLGESDIAEVVDYIRAALMSGTAISGTRAHGGRDADQAVASQVAPSLVNMNVEFPEGLKGNRKRGGAFYLANCATCHGARGDGAGPRAYFINPKPRNFTEDASRARFNRVALYAAVSEGRLGSEMPAWKQVATPQQIADVSEYVFQSFVQGKATEVAGSPAQR
ncbi:MAG TPA: c-type cytochrome [Burkholderiaceae bacterium]|nr:c-type cytochrome [Burkholderiaceae bacterium]